MVERKGMGIELDRSGVRVVRRSGGKFFRLVIPLSSTALETWGPAWHEAPGTPASCMLMGQSVGGREAASCLLRLARTASSNQWGQETGPVLLLCDDLDSAQRRRDLLDAARIAGWDNVKLAETSWAAAHQGPSPRLLTINLTWDSLDLHVHENTPRGYEERHELSLAGGWGEWLQSVTLPSSPFRGWGENEVREKLRENSLDSDLTTRIEATWLPHFREAASALASLAHRASLGRGDDVGLMWIGPIARPAGIGRILSDALPMASWHPGEASWLACEGAALMAASGTLPPITRSSNTREPLGVKVSRRIAHRLHHGYFSPLLPSGATPGAKKRATFSTVAAHQKSITLEVLEGLSRLAADNTPLGRLVLEDIPPDQRPQDLLVDFEIAPTGELKVAAQMAKSGQRVTARFEEGRPLAESWHIVDLLTGTL